LDPGLGQEDHFAPDHADGFTFATSSDATSTPLFASIQSYITGTIASIKEWTVDRVTAVVGVFYASDGRFEKHATAITIFDKNGKAGCLTVDDVTTGQIKVTTAGVVVACSSQSPGRHLYLTRRHIVHSEASCLSFLSKIVIAVAVFSNRPFRCVNTPTTPSPCPPSFLDRSDGSRDVGLNRGEERG